MFQAMYDKMITWSKHPRAVRYLAALSFAESSFFPIPPDVMLAPMAMAKPNNAYYYAFITTIYSVLGGIVGYLIGHLLYEPVVIPLFSYLSLQDKLPMVQELFDKWGPLAVLIAGFATPVPYKLITITTGTFGVNFPLFVLFSLLSRGSRFFMVSGCMKFGGNKLEEWIRGNINKLLILFVLALVVLFSFLY